MQHQTHSHHLDPRSPLVLDTKDLPRRPGAMRVVERTVPAPDGLGLALIGVATGTDLALSLRLESVSEGVLVSGTATAAVTGECGRCLRPIGDTLEVPLQELYAYEHSTTDETTDEDKVGRLQGDLICRTARCAERTVQGCAPSAGYTATSCPPTTRTGRSTHAGPR